MRSPRFFTWLLGVPIVAICHASVYLALTSVVFAIGDAPRGPQGMWEVLSDLLVLVVSVLGFPFMTLPSTARGLELSRTVFGDDSAAMFGLMTLNALVWGTALIALTRYLRRRRRVVLYANARKRS